MASDDLLASWERTRGHLARAWVKLPIGVDTDQFQEYLDHNELELAMEALARLGETVQATPSLWEALADAANEMELSQKASAFKKRADRPADTTGS